ncbi:MAG: hypothetical protein ACXQTQ_03260 [Candidatus Hecatellaceae archaeon]|nr:MAG: hypothetical protein DRO43_02065 [Candidatus Hecatellales archaeon]
MGEVFRPDSLAGRRLPSSKLPGDVRPSVPASPLSLQALYEQVRELREELEKVKTALKKHGIALEG